MGEDFLRRRNDRFVRHRDARFAQQLKPDLFSVCAPNVAVNVYGTALGDVQVKSELWAPEVAASGPIRFYQGDSPAVQLEGPAADRIRADYGEARVPIVAEVVQVDGEHGVVVLSVGCGL